MKRLIICLLMVDSLAYGQAIDTMKYRWKLGDIYSSIEQWNTDLEKFSAGEYFPSSITMQGDLIRYCQGTSKLLQDYEKLDSYLTLREHENQAFDFKRQREQLMFALTSHFQKSDGIERRIPIDLLKSVVARDDMTDHRRLLENLMQLASSDQDRIDFQNQATHAMTYRDDYRALRRIIKYPDIILKSGKKVNAASVDHRMFTDRDDRQSAYLATYGATHPFLVLFNSQFAAKINDFRFRSKVYGDSSSIGYLYRTRKDPVRVYDLLIESINKNLPIHYRYLNIMRKVLHIDTLRSWDIEHIPRNDEPTLYPITDGISIIRKALAPYGRVYTETIDEAIKNNWIDAFRRPEKGSRVFSQSVPGVHPFVSVEYDNSFNGVRSLAHELGHCVEYKLSEGMPLPYNRAHALLLEVPSTLNESLVTDYLIRTRPKERRVVLFDKLFYLMGSCFSNAVEAESALQLHKRADKKGKVTRQDVENVYMEMRRKYFGEHLGISRLHDFDAAWWTGSYHHIQYDFPFMGYVMGAVITSKLKRNLMEGQITSQQYQTFISAGSNRAIEDILLEVKVDLKNPDTYQAIFDEMSSTLDMLELELAGDGVSRH